MRLPLTPSPVCCLAVLLAACGVPSAGAQSIPAPSPSFELGAAYSEAHGGQALLVWDHETLAFEAYHNGFSAEQPHRLFSGTKTFSGLVALAAAEDGLLTLDEPVAHTLTEWAGDPQKSTITIRQLLHLVGGLEGTVGAPPSFEEAISRPLVFEPGTAFQYGPTAFQVFGAVMARKLDGEDVRAYLQRRILDPIGAEVADWVTIDGDPDLASGASMTAADWLRVGRLLLQQGRWDGRQVLAPASIDALTEPVPAAPGYGLTVWINAVVDPEDAFIEGAPRMIRAASAARLIYPDGPADLYMAAGALNQRLYVIPSRGTTILRFGRAGAGWSDAEFLARLLDGVEYEAPAPAEAAGDGTSLARLQLARLNEALDLTPDQEHALLPILERRTATLVEARATLQGGNAGRRQKRRIALDLRQVLNETDRQIESHLTREQIPAYRAFVEENRDELRQRVRDQRNP